MVSARTRASSLCLSDELVPRRLGTRSNSACDVGDRCDRPDRATCTPAEPGRALHCLDRPDIDLRRLRYFEVGAVHPTSAVALAMARRHGRGGTAPEHCGGGL